MANEKTCLHVRKAKRKFTLIFGILILLLIATFVGAGFSFAKYTQSKKSMQSATVGNFVPTITCDERWEETHTLVAGSASEPENYPFTVTNDDVGMSVLVIVELTVEQVLPLECDLYLGTERLEPDSVQNDRRTYTYLLRESKAEFSLSVFWPEGEYDERFNGLTNDVRMVVVCEQAQPGGAE